MTRPDWPQEELSELTARVKKRLRERLASTRKTLPGPAVAARSARIVERLIQLPVFTEARSVALFWPMLGRGEVDLRPLDIILQRRGVARYYPFMDKNERGTTTTGFRRVENSDDLAPRGRKFVEPPPEVPAAKNGDIDLVLVPAIAVSPRGQRIGFGVGFYDATLPEFCPPARAVVLAFSFQVVMEIPAEPHDVACDWVVTDEEVFEAAPKRQ